MTVFGISEKGKYRKENQDAILICRKGNSGLFIVADGVGSSVDGSRASNLIVREYDQWWKNIFLKSRQKNFFQLFEEIKELAEEINDSICRSYGVGFSSSTIVLLFIHKGIYGYISAGDSRIYYSGRNGVRLITKDDVWENRPGADIYSGHYGKIISAIGGYSTLEYSCATDRVHWGEVFMLCSDGIYKFVEEDVIKASLKKLYRSLFLREKMIQGLVEKAIYNDTRDNYSLIILKR